MERTRSLANISTILSDIANAFEVAVVVINHMTTRVEKYASFLNSHNSNKINTVQTSMDISTENGTKLIPALGESWAHSTTTRIIL